MLFTNTVSQFVDHETTVSVPAKDYEVSTLMLTQEERTDVGTDHYDCSARGQPGHWFCSLVPAQEEIGYPDKRR